ncbi:non-structural maintenance of chromosomes element 1 homolog [Pollicipes pollicipes]|uniref:non-structural maintenance of chromosomes element 1 homolog n=1 Tax=Pollicipes pollicipes TaxID=41117 RepID=UPI00188584F3|nr:non-structural maintenance of chromosomes element 1 homolog [Pollicipes pollicipes]XP_037093474.1 non-structural maintenance of chromosomes element 1 homolog [Pollicipes pollicipes]XP_037093475.1 non-structural maintenance of chromosomes element 1 homolog [Pollicipes pollicipes]XP_037093476.1 non-structural maintenance of chromosomes element 1 homolog [Pollicipes pollicipes]XP_037093477.1 non-structural maintenance of chromosomes element 1 homolog [Pollicipes pollicipes]XP_037093478.1 non-s
MTTYCDDHRRVAQALMSQPALSEAKLLALIRPATAAQAEAGEHDRSRLKAFVDVVNEQLRPLGLEITKRKSESDGERMYALLSFVDVPPTRDKPELQLLFMQAIAGEVFTSTDGCISSTDALHLADGLPCKTTSTQAQSMLTKLIGDGWLEDAGFGHVCLSTRCIMEMESYLKRHYPGYVLSCPLCNDLVVRGEPCADCGNERYHRPCLREYIQKVGAKMCTQCGSQLTPAPADRAG